MLTRQNVGQVRLVLGDWKRWLAVMLMASVIGWSGCGGDEDAGDGGDANSSGGGGAATATADGTGTNGQDGGSQGTGTSTGDMANSGNGTVDSRSQGTGSGATTSGTAVSGDNIDLSMLPQESELVVLVKLADLWQSPQVAQLHETPILGQFVENFAEVGLEPADFESITVGGQHLEAMQSEEEGPEENFLMVIRLNRDTTPESMGITDHDSTEVNGQTVYRVSDGPTDPFVYPVDARTLLIASPGLLEASLAGGSPSAELTSRFAFATAGHHITVAVAPVDPAGMMASAQAEAPEFESESASELVHEIEEHLQGLTVGLTLENGLQLGVVLNCDNDHGAEEIKGLIDQGIAELSDEVASNPQAQMMAGGLLAQLTNDQVGNTVQIATNMNEQQVAGLIAMASFAAMAANGGMDPEFGDTGPDVDTLMTDGAEPSNVSGLPEGVELRTLPSWQAPDFSFDGAEPIEELSLPLAFLGGNGGSIIAVSDVTLERLDSSTGRLKPAPSFEFKQAATGTLAIDRGDWGGQPENGAIIGVAYVKPVEAVDMVQRYAGQITLHMADEQTEIEIDDLLAFVDGTDDDVLQAAGLSVEKVVDPDFDQETVEVRVAEGYAILSMSVLDEDGDESFDVNAYNSHGGISRHWTVSAFEDLPETIPVRITLGSALHAEAVSFEFSDLVVPETEPLTEDEIARTIWTASTITDGVPEGLEVEAKAKWSDFGLVDDDGNEVRPLEIHVDVIGPQAATALAIGNAQFEVASSDAGPLEQGESFSDPEDINDIDREYEDHTYPMDGAQVTFTFAPTEDAPTEIEEFRGSFTLRTVESQTHVDMADASSKLGDEITIDNDAGLEITVVVSVDDSEVRCTVTGSDAESVQDVEVIDASGNVIKPTFSGRFGFGGEVQISANYDQAPEEFGIRVIINEGVDEATIPFAFENLPVPPEPEGF